MYQLSGATKFVNWHIKWSLNPHICMIFVHFLICFEKIEQRHCWMTKENTIENLYFMLLSKTNQSQIGIFSYQTRDLSSCNTTPPIYFFLSSFFLDPPFSLRFFPLSCLLTNLYGIRLHSYATSLVRSNSLQGFVSKTIVRQSKPDTFCWSGPAGPTHWGWSWPAGVQNWVVLRLRMSDMLVWLSVWEAITVLWVTWGCAFASGTVKASSPSSEKRETTRAWFWFWGEI